MIETRGEQDLLHELVDLPEAAHDLRPDRGIGRARQHLDTHAEPRQRRAELVAGIAEERPLRCEEVVQSLGRDVEGPRHRGHLVAAARVEPRCRIPRSPLLHPASQGLEPAGQPRRDRERREADAARHECHRDEDAQADAGDRRPQSRHDGSAVGEIDAQDMPGFARLGIAAKINGPAVRRQKDAARVVDRHVGADLASQAVDRPGDGARGLVLGGDHLGAEVDPELAPPLLGQFAQEPPQAPHQHGDRDEARQKRQVDFPEQPALQHHHGSASCVLAKT